MSKFSHAIVRQNVLAIIDELLKSINPYTIVLNHLNSHKANMSFSDFARGNGRLFVISVGKAAMPMCQAVCDFFGHQVHAGIGISKQPIESWPQENSKITFYQGNHPIPGEQSVLATTAVLNLLDQTKENDIVLCLISGGTSALLTKPIISLPDWQLLNNSLLASGCTINQFNTVRRQLDQIKGGGLAASAGPARVEALILSDVIGDDLAAIGSGPTVATQATPQDTIDIIKQTKADLQLDTAVYERILSALQTAPKPQAPNQIKNSIIGSISIAAQAAKQQAETLGFQSKIITTHLESEAREAGKFAAAIAKDLHDKACFILGGETTVTLKGDGIGGRNLELALAAAITLDGFQNKAIITFATDGDDGPTGAAGAIVTGETAGYGRELNMDAQQYLNNNDSYTYFKTLDDAGYGPHLIITGQTGTNVNDLLIVMSYD